MVSIKKAFLISLLLTLLIFTLDSLSKSGFFVLQTKHFFITKVIDGDTIELSNGEIVRLLGINAPEINAPFGKDAKEFLSQLVEGKDVYIETDLSKRDNYGRILAFMFVGEKNINLEMVRNGFAHVFELEKISKYVKELNEAELYAIKNQIGIWKRSNITCIKLLDLKVSGYEKVVLKNNCNFSVQIKDWILEDANHNRFIFPSYLLKPNEIIEVYSTNKTAKFSFKNDFPIWNKEGDTLFLRDAHGLLVLFYRY